MMNIKAPCKITYLFCLVTVEEFNKLSLTWWRTHWNSQLKGKSWSTCNTPWNKHRWLSQWMIRAKAFLARRCLAYLTVLAKWKGQRSRTVKVLASALLSWNRLWISTTAKWLCAQMDSGEAVPSSWPCILNLLKIIRWNLLVSPEYAYSLSKVSASTICRMKIQKRLSR